MVSLSNMNNDSSFRNLKEFTSIYLNLLDSSNPRITENNDQFNINIDGVGPLQTLISKIIPFRSILKLFVDIEIQNGSTTLSLNDGGLFIYTRWVEDQSLSPPILDDQDFHEFQTIVTPYFEEEGSQINLDLTASLLNTWLVKGAHVKIKTRITVEKTALIESWNLPNDTKCILYFSIDKLSTSITETNFQTLQRTFVPNSEKYIVILIANASGYARGSNIEILGHDFWEIRFFDKSFYDESSGNKILDALSIRDTEVSWVHDSSQITPYHFAINFSKITPLSICNTFNYLCDCLCISFIANKVAQSSEGIIADFSGYQHVKIQFPQQIKPEAKSEIFPLFQWAYENSSSDKLEIIRNLISLRLSKNSLENFEILLNEGRQILESSKGNFRFLIKKSVEQYFDNKLKLSEYLQKNNKTIGENITNIATEMINNVYKTIGIILGVIITSLISPNSIPGVVHWTSLLYFCYIVFIMIILLPYTYIKFCNEYEEYNQNIGVMKDILIGNENREREIIQKNRIHFLLYFGFSNLIYAGLGTTAILITKTVY